MMKDLNAEMNIDMQRDRVAFEKMSALDAQRLAHEISFGPVIFQVSRLMVKWGIFQMLVDSENGLTIDEIVQKTGMSHYAIQSLVEASYTAGTVLRKENRYEISKTGWFLMNDPLVKVDMAMVHDVIYKGLFYLEECLLQGKPVGLWKVFGNYPTIYEALSSLPSEVQKSWFDWDHYFSDQSFGHALPIVFRNNPGRILDIGGNTGKFALRCVEYNEEVRVTIVDLPQQLELMKKYVKDKVGADRISGYPLNLLDASSQLPVGYDVIWLSQLVSAFSEEEVTSLLTKVASVMEEGTSLIINETLWDRQRFDSASYCLTQITIYFACLANGNSKMYNSEDLFRCIRSAGLSVESVYDNIGKGHSLLICKKI